MYLRSLGDWSVEQARQDCINGGGIPIPLYGGGPNNYVTGYNCSRPSGGGGTPANITVTVPTTTSTTVSPQVSPQFIQQQQPTNSPIGVELQGPREGADAEALAEQERMRQAELLDLFRSMQPQPQSTQINIPHTTASADESRMPVQFEEAGFPILPALLLAAAGAGILMYRNKGARRSSRKKSRRK